jgi:hypothetical protein
MTNSRDILEALRCRSRRESLERASPSAPRANLLGVLAALSAVDKIAGRPAEASLPSLRKDAQRSQWDWPAGQPRRFQSTADWYLPFGSRVPEGTKGRGTAKPEGAQPEGRLTGGNRDHWPDGGVSGTEDVLSSEDMKALAARRWRGRFF